MSFDQAAIPTQPHPPRPGPARLGLGLDAGGTATRWAVATAQGMVLHEGQAAGFSGLQLATAQGAAEVAQVLADIHAQWRNTVAFQAQPALHGVCLGATGFDGDASGPLAALVQKTFQVAPAHVRLFNDVELACRAAFAPGQGYLIYAGTGSVAAFVDEHERLHRAGGRGGIIDDGGSGHWIAREALRHIWRAEDEAPGAWHTSPLARSVFSALGGSDWATTRTWVYTASRGQLGALAVAVAAAADDDPAAMAIMQAAGQELARLGMALVRRCGVRPLAFAGRVFELHGAIQSAARAALMPHQILSCQTLPTHGAAAKIAALT